MFTGIIEAMATVEEVKRTGDGFRMRLETSLAGSLKVGDSLAVNGVCLTVMLIDGEQVLADIGPETARVTTLASLQRGQQVNLERPLRSDGRLDGHFVLGHVDEMGTVEELRKEGASHWITVEFPPSLAPYLVWKGSVAMDGVSLTIAGLGDRHFDVQIIPFTWSNTTLRTLRKGDKVNLECDVLGKHVARVMDTKKPS
ncbi:MAG: riboflavin synthase [Vicinamibacterales bacterium]